MNKMKKFILIILLLLSAHTLLTAGGRRPAQDPLIARRVSPTQYKKSSSDMVVTYIDVGQGNAVLVESPTGVTLLYDAGGTPEWSQSSWDPGIEIVVPFLKKRGIEKLDYAIMSHAHGDHIGGYKAVLYNFEVGKFLDPGYVYPSAIYEELLTAVKKKKIKYELVKAGYDDKIKLGSEITCRVFSPPPDHYHQGTNSDCNNSSVLLKISYGEVAFLFPGDLESEGEIYCAKKYGHELEANILQVGHHGSATSSTRPFLEMVMPEVAVIPVGKNNTFGHPNPAALSNLEAIGAEIYRTDYDGNVVIYSDGRKFIVEIGN
ncbi:MAG: ComEC/Rec2 family competence protein [Elusimicrobiota bacterium]